MGLENCSHIIPDAAKHKAQIMAFGNYSVPRWSKSSRQLKSFNLRTFRRFVHSFLAPITIRSILSLALIGFIQFGLMVGSRAQQTVALDQYTCSQFLNDINDIADGERLLRSLMMISWATGYVAAHQAGTPRADPTAVQLIAATLGDVCRKTPNPTVVSTIEKVIEQFTSTSSLAPTVAPSSTNAEVEFITHDNSDIYGGDYRKIELADLKACVTSCLSDVQCKAYSYDKWNRVCFLKREASVLLLEPSSMTGVRSGTQVERASSAIKIEKRANRSFAGKMYAAKHMANFESCQTLCMSETNCVTFSYAKTAKQCRLYSSVENYRAENGIESGIKRQTP